jgi:hypothetical protein
MDLYVLVTERGECPGERSGVIGSVAVENDCSIGGDAPRVQEPLELGLTETAHPRAGKGDGSREVSAARFAP